MTTELPTLQLKPRPVSIVDLYEGKPIPSHLYYAMRYLFNNPSPKARNLARKLYEHFDKNMDKELISANESTKFVINPYNFILPKKISTADDVNNFYARLNLMLKNQLQGVQVYLTQQQFELIQQPGVNQLIYYHGNQFLTGAPFYAGGIPNIFYFQWGNLFGVAKPQELESEKALKANLLIYFEDKRDRNISNFIQTYQQKQVPHIQTHPKIVLPIISIPQENMLSKLTFRAK